LNIAWYSKTSDTGMSTGYIGDGSDTTAYKVGVYTATDLKYVESGSLVKFIAPPGQYFDTNNNNKLKIGAPSLLGHKTYIWAKVVSISGDGTANGTGLLASGFGPIKLNSVVPTGSIITQIIPQWRTVISPSVITTMIDLIFSNKPFGLRYDTTTQTWQIIFESNVDSTNAFSLGKQGDVSNQQLDSSWLLLFTTDNEFYTVTSRELRYIFESNKKIRFYFDSTNKIYNSKTNTIVKDNVKVLSINTVPDSTSPFTYDQNWDIVGGLSFLPRADYVYQLAPYEEIDEKQYKELLKRYESLDFSKIVVYEQLDETDVKAELACAGGNCEADVILTTAEKVAK
jgi:hypothetical protein